MDHDHPKPAFSPISGEAKPVAYDAYQQLADDYARLIDEKPHNAYYDRPAMIGMLPDVDGKQVLDIGCGPGAYSEVILQRGGQVIAVDISDRMLELASQRLSSFLESGRVRLIQHDLNQPFTMLDSGLFSVVNAPLCLDYIESWLPLFREVHRLLEPGGQFLFSVGHPSFDAEHFKTQTYFQVESVSCIWKGFGPHVEVPSYRRSLEEVFQPIIDSGLRIDRVHEPLPTDEFRKADLIRYRRLMHRPGFICIRATKD